ncbi:MAG TPA: phosphotransferase family protein [Caulobacteraceae bacterium]|nr:phosphotransferase family protein [Caulobacteraceae bacterium]
MEAWIASHVEALRPPFTWSRLPGGHSNLTYLLTDQQGARAVVRRPPLGQLLPGAHDMFREWRVISALGPTRVPVPAALGFCEDESVTGARFYVMGFVEGHALYGLEDVRRWLPEPLRRGLAYDFIDVLAELHALDPDEVGLGELGKRENYVGRQLSTWYKSWLASAGPAEFDDPRAHELQRFLLANAPDQGPARVVHGDYGVHNCLAGADGKVAAILDWEISTLGDPLADLAYALNQWHEPGEAASPRGRNSTSAPGFPARSELARRYADRTGRDLSNLDYYVCFNRWKSACIIHGVYARYREGKKGVEDIDLDALRLSIQWGLKLADEARARLQA